MGIILASIPLFVLLIAVELCLAWLGRRPFYRLHDSISDLSAGILSQLAGIATKLLLLVAPIRIQFSARRSRMYMRCTNPAAYQEVWGVR